MQLPFLFSFVSQLQSGLEHSFPESQAGPSPAAISSSGFQQEATTLLVLVSLAPITVPPGSENELDDG